jgi:dTDP-L-rhamnose 4-epimerase
MNVLITGGAGFIGQHTAKRLIDMGHSVYILDNLSEQIHGCDVDAVKEHIRGKFIHGDIRDRAALEEAFSNDIEVIYHFAAETGTGQSMYEIAAYTDVNIQGTANLLSYIQENNSSGILKKIIVASSRAIYGEGAYSCSDHGEVYPDIRKDTDILDRNFENKCPVCDAELKLLHTNEGAPFKPASIYGLTKQVQEQMILMFAANSNIQAYSLRYQNVYGPGQSLLNPYTGILAVFSNLARNGSDINIFEDGLESRDFVYIDDVVNANILCLQDSSSFVGVLNIGTGESITVNEVAKLINEFFDSQSKLQISGMYRVGDIRHNKADISKATKMINFTARVSFRDGLQNFLEWACLQKGPADYGFESSITELKHKGLMLGA